MTSESEKMRQIMVGKYLDVPLEDHPIASAFPLLPDEELRELSKDIEQKGLMNPIVIHQDQILDGRNRYRAIKLMPSWSGKLELRWLMPYFGPNPYEYVVSMNCRRRHLTGGQRAAIATELANLEHGQRADRVDASIDASKLGKANVDSSIELSTPITQKQAAKLLNVSQSSVKRAKAVREADPELHAKVKSGEVTLNTALKAIKPEPEPPKSRTAPGMGEDQDQPNPQTNSHLDAALIEAMTTAIEMVGNSENLGRGELRSALTRARAFIDQKTRRHIIEKTYAKRNNRKSL